MRPGNRKAGFLALIGHPGPATLITHKPWVLLMTYACRSTIATSEAAFSTDVFAIWAKDPSMTMTLPMVRGRAGSNTSTSAGPSRKRGW